MVFLIAGINFELQNFISQLTSDFYSEPPLSKYTPVTKHRYVILSSMHTEFRSTVWK